MDRSILRKTLIISIIILFLSTSFIPFVNANIQNENNLNIKNINLDDIKTIINRLKDSDCNCKKTADNNSKSLFLDLLCSALILLSAFIIYIAEVLHNHLYSDLYDLAFRIVEFGYYTLHCDWYFAFTFNKLFANNEQFLYNFFKFSYLGLGDVYEK